MGALPTFSTTSAGPTAMGPRSNSTTGQQFSSVAAPLPVVEVVSAISSHRGPVLARFHLHTDDLAGAPPSLLEGFLDFWAGWPETPSAPLLLVCLVVTYRAEAGL